MVDLPVRINPGWPNASINESGRLPDNQKDPKMNNFETTDQLWHQVLTDIEKDGELIGSRDGETKEILDATYILDFPRNNIVHHPIRAMNPSYMGMELLWYMAGQDYTEVPEFFAPHYARFAQDQLRGDALAVDRRYCWGAYGARINGEQAGQGANEYIEALAQRRNFVDQTQLECIVEMLGVKPQSRQAVLQLWSAKDLVHATAGGMNDVPCTNAIHFLIRNGDLRMTVWMRSSDAWLGLPNDIFAFTSIQRILAQQLSIGCGQATFHMTSLHYYMKHKEKVLKTLEMGIKDLYNELEGYAPCTGVDACLLFGELQESIRRLRREEALPLPSVINKSHLSYLDVCFAAAMRRVFAGENNPSIYAKLQEIVDESFFKGLKEC